MFELNLIKDRAIARRRRMLISMIVGAISLLALLSTMFILIALVMVEWRALKLAESRFISQETVLKETRAALDLREPKVKDRRRDLILAYNEDRKLLDDRVYVAPVFEALSLVKPQDGKFWYREVTIAAQTADTGTGEKSAMVAPRTLVGSGTVEVTQSDETTEHALQQLRVELGQFPEFIRAVGVPNYTLLPSAGGQGGGIEGRYSNFRVGADSQGGGFNRGLTP